MPVREPVRGLAEYPTLTVEGIGAAAAYGAELARDEYRGHVRIKLDENLPESGRLAGCISVWRDGDLRVRRP